MRERRSGGDDPWPAGPMVARPWLMEQTWSEAVILHWRLLADVAAGFMPPGTEPDVFGRSTWVGLIGFRMSGVRLGRVLPVPYVGSFVEVNVRLYSRGADGSRGIVFLSLDAPRLPVVLVARALRIPYVRSQCRSTGTDGSSPVRGYEVERRGGQPASRFAVRPDLSVPADDELSLGLTARFGAHTRFVGRTFFLPVSHRPWPLHPAELVHLDDGLLGAAGLEVTGPPESVLFSPGVDTVFGRPWSVPES